MATLFIVNTEALLRSSCCSARRGNILKNNLNAKSRSAKYSLVILCRPFFKGFDSDKKIMRLPLQNQKLLRENRENSSLGTSVSSQIFNARV